MYKTKNRIMRKTDKLIAEDFTCHLSEAGQLEKVEKKVKNIQEHINKFS